MRAQSLAAIALLAALSGVSCYDADRLTAPDDILLLTASPEIIPANGFSTARITARISTSADRGLTISFTNSGGTLSSTEARGPDSNGEVSVFLTSESTPKTALVTAEVKEGATIVASRSVSVTFETAAPGSVIRLFPSATQISADGVSSVQLRAEADSAGPRSVTFKTTDGSFVRNANPPVIELTDVATGADGVALAQLFAPLTPGSALVTATAGGFSASQTVSFVPALPDFISLRATPLEVSRALETNTIDLVAVLSRAVGTVTRNTRVDFSAVNDMSGATFGRFQDVTRSNESETVTAEFVPGTAAPLGLATITARVTDGDDVVAQVKVHIIP